MNSLLIHNTDLAVWAITECLIMHNSMNAGVIVANSSVLYFIVYKTAIGHMQTIYKLINKNSNGTVNVNDI